MCSRSRGWSPNRGVDVVTERTVRVQGGKEHVIYAALLNEFHQQYRHHDIDTELIQIPTPDNGNVAIVKAKVKGTTANEEEDRSFSGIGDASPENVGRNIVPHIIRMAETRAKARALRDAVNIGSNEFEELEGKETLQRPAKAVREQPRASHGSVANDSAGTLTDESAERTELLDEITQLARDLGHSEEKIQEKLSDIIDEELHDLERYASVMRTRLLERHHEMKGAAKS